MDRIVSDIVFDFSVKPRLSDHQGNAILVASSIYEACKYYSLFQKTPFKGKCAVVTSYNPHERDISKEEIGANTETDKQFVYQTYMDILESVEDSPGKSKTEVYEDHAKALFEKEPANMHLLVVVDKLLTGFDAPACTYLYIDKSMQDHGLFQAICRTNRLDGDSKTYGYIVDYKNMFKKMEKAIAVYTAELDKSDGGADPAVMMQSRLEKGREGLDEALEALSLLCEGIEPPGTELEQLHYFCGNTEIPEDLAQHEPQRIALYKGVVKLLRAYGAIADDLEPAGYDAKDMSRIKRETDAYLHLRDIVRKASGESLDLKPYEADMRHLIDTYIEADEPRKISPFDNMGLLELIVKTGIVDAIAARLGGMKGNQNAVGESIENNVRAAIIKEHLNNPGFYGRMSAQLQEIIDLRKSKAIDYEAYLKKVAELAKRVHDGFEDKTAEALKRSPALRAVYDFLTATDMTRAAEKPREEKADSADNRTTTSEPYDVANDPNLHLAIQIDKTIKEVRPSDFRGFKPKENIIKAALLPLLRNDREVVERLYLIIERQKEY